DLGYNSLQGSLPASLGNLTLLTGLQVDSTGLQCATGGWCELSQQTTSAFCQHCSFFCSNCSVQPADVCASFQFNPCGGGACVSLPNGTYTCQCPLGTTIGNNGTIAPTCVPCPTCLNSPNPPSTSPPSASPPSTSPPPTSPPPTIPPPTSLPSTSPPPTSPAPASAPPPIASSGTPSGEQAGGNASGTQEPQAPSQARSGKGLGVEGSIISSCAIVLLLQTLMLM
ncbi:unnamed protein product, partial [Closterium sp. NIES-53]